MNRRKFTILSLGSLASLILSRKPVSSSILSQMRPSPANDVGFDLSDLFSNPRSAEAIGSRYLAQYPHKRDPDALIAELDLPSPESGRHDRASLKSRINVSQRRDFAMGNTVIVDKWILSRTEANLCALIALS